MYVEITHFSHLFSRCSSAIGANRPKLFVWGTNEVGYKMAKNFRPGPITTGDMIGNILQKRWFFDTFYHDFRSAQWNRLCLWIKMNSFMFDRKRKKFWFFWPKKKFYKSSTKIRKIKNFSKKKISVFFDVFSHFEVKNEVPEHLRWLFEVFWDICFQWIYYWSI